jgi:cytoskeletal protein CcmA (bactofilin family)
MNINLNNMFGNKSKENTSQEDTRSFIKTPNTQEKVLTLISGGCKFEGNLSSPSTTKIDGHVVGNLRGESGIIIGEKGIVDGNVNAVDVVIYGAVKGNIKAHKLEIKRTGSLIGDVDIEELATETGSKFNGSCKMGGLQSKSNILNMNNDDIGLPADKAKLNEKPVVKFN